jgi:hypothetical protein
LVKVNEASIAYRNPFETQESHLQFPPTSFGQGNVPVARNPAGGYDFYGVYNLWYYFCAGRSAGGFILVRDLV